MLTFMNKVFKAYSNQLDANIICILLLQELTTEQRREEQIKYGIYFDDDYNYLQHLKHTREVTMVVQPVSIRNITVLKKTE